MRRAVADFVDMAVDRRERNAKVARIGLAQLGDVIGDRSLILPAERFMLGREKLLEGKFDPTPRAAAVRSSD